MPHPSSPSSLPPSCGISLKSVHFEDILSKRPDVGWFEIHPENYMSKGGLDHKYLDEISQHYPISMHGVGMSLGSYEGVDKSHLAKLKILIDRYEPAQVSEHLSWSHNQGLHFNDLLPLSLTEKNFDVVRQNIERVQEILGRTILIENPSLYLMFTPQDYSEPDFLNLLAQKTGCGLLLDINNIYVSAMNNNIDPLKYLNDIDKRKIGEIHLAGHKIVPLTDDKSIRIDDHGAPVSEAVWQLFEKLIKDTQTHFPVLVEWDTDIPNLAVLVNESKKAQTIMKSAIDTSLK